MKVLIHRYDDKEEDSGIEINWDNGKTVILSDSLKSDLNFWKIINIVLEDARREGEINALQIATKNAQIQIDAQKKLSTPRIIL